MSDVIRIKDLRNRVGQTVSLRGWVCTARSSGKIAFVVLRDGSGGISHSDVRGTVDIPEDKRRRRRRRN